MHVLLIRLWEGGNMARQQVTHPQRGACFAMAEDILRAVVSGGTVAAKLHERVLAGYDKESRALQLYYTEHECGKVAVEYE